MNDGIDRVVIVNDSAAARGGATSLARMLAQRLAQSGVAVTFLCGELGPDAEGADGPLAAAGVDVATLGQARLLSRGTLTALRVGLWNGAARDLVGDWIARNDTPRTVYHLHGWAQILSPAVFAALRPVARRCVLHAHDFFLACPNGSYMNYPSGTLCKLRPLSGGCLATACDKRSPAQKAWRVARHGVLRRYVLGAPWGAIAMIHPAMEEPLARAGLPAASLTVALNPAEPFSATRIEAERNRRIAYVGRLAPEKGVIPLAAAAAQLGLEVTFVGEGPEEARIRALLPGARITGWQQRAQIASHIRDARALAMPSLLPEPFGLAAAEASLSGLPVILPDITSLAAGMAAGGIGVSYAATGPGALEHALAEIRDMPDEKVREMSLRAASGSTRIAQSPEDWTTQLMQIYGRLAGHERAAA